MAGSLWLVRSGRDSIIIYDIIELVDSISRDELDVPLTQYITNA